ncbi:hypothetical protein [Lacinutrix salivirga]
MGHNISAIIGENNVNKEKIKELGLAAAFESNYVIIILDFDAMIELEETLNKSSDSESINLSWDCKLTKFIAKEIGLEKFALIQTDYFGGIGEQYASYFEDERKILSEVGINEALKSLGVKTKDNQDEFDALNLGEYRESEYYYWDIGNWAEKKENMIAGRILNK